jgi:predicted  nucleic acid-binding Zn-ribbon protein
MPHQCLECGKVFPSGSKEILKGCDKCGGKKFFYTEQPVSEKERERLTEQANKDIKVLIHEVLSQSGHERLTTYDSEGKEVSPGSRLSTPAGGWVKISPSGEISAPGEVPGKGAPAGEEPQKLPTVKDLLKQLRDKPELGLELPVPDEVKEDPKIAKTRPKRKGKVKIKRKRKAGVRKRKPQPEVIKVVEPGVYEIYLSKLLKQFPIIINKDGTYLLHLPSVFESMLKEKK